MFVGDVDGSDGHGGRWWRGRSGGRRVVQITVESHPVESSLGSVLRIGLDAR